MNVHCAVKYILSNMLVGLHAAYKAVKKKKFNFFFKVSKDGSFNVE